MSRKRKKKFEEMHDVIDAVMMRRQSKWRLKAVAWLDFDDIKQIIKVHIYNKWHLWDQTRPIEPWLNRVISNQIRNLIRNHYTTYAKPCYSCPHNLNKNYAESGQEYSCAATKSKTQCAECPLYARWEQTKKEAYNIKLPVTIENHKNYHLSLEENVSWDFAAAEKKMHELMKEELSPKHFFIYRMFFIDHLSDEQVSKILKFKTSEKGRKAGYRQIKNLKQLMYLRAVQLLKENDVFSD